MTDFISAELAATCAALGYDNGISYLLDPHCLDVIKDLIKYLKRDDDSHTVRQYLGRAKLLETDLKKIFIQHCDKLQLWDVLLRLLINLTSPALMVYDATVPSEKSTRTTYEQLVVYLQGYKVSLADEQVWTVVGKRLKNILNTDPAERGEENAMIIERILTLIRNVLQVPPNDNEIRAENDATVHDEVLFAMHTSGLVDMLLFVASNVSEQQYHIQVLEIVALMLTEQCPTKLASVGLQRTNAEKEKDAAKLLAIRDKEVRERMEKIKKYAGSRHSRFGGTFVVQNMKAIGDNQMICHKPYQKMEALEFGQEKAKIKKTKAKTPMSDSKQERTSALSVRLFLKEFCVEFLNGAYNPVMRYARFCINGGGDAGLASDASYFLWTLRFFMEFNRHYKFQVKYVSETISAEIFHLVRMKLEDYYDMMTADKKQNLMWFKRMHLAMKAYQELLLTLAAMDKANDEGVRESSKIIKSNIFYLTEYREVILTQLIHYDDVKMSRAFLADLVTTSHIFLKMLREFCGGDRTMIVGKKKTNRTSVKAKKKRKEASRASSLPKKTLEEIWDEVAPEISAVMREGTIPEVVPFDATLEIPIDAQKSEAMKKIQIFLRKREFEQAVGLLRASREVWPENDCFGKPDIPPEEEFMALREIFLAELGVDIDYGNEEQREEAANDDKEEDDEENDDDDEEEEANAAMTIQETNFNFDEFLRRFANVKVVKAMASLLRQFEENSDQVNHYIVKMLHRIAWDCKMYGMLFQASIFRVFQRILDSDSSRHKELQKFAVFIIRKFAEVAERNPKIYMELLFWKTTREVTEMVEGYDVEPTNNKVSRVAWTEAEEDELRILFMEHQSNNYTQDLIDWILENIISDNRTRRGVIKKLKEMCLVVNSKATKSAVQKRLPKEWSEQEITELSELWDRLKDDEDPIGTIYDALSIKRPAKSIKEKLLETGLASDRKELRKKRRREGPPKLSWETKSLSEQSDTEYSETESRPKKTQPKSNHKAKRKRAPIVYTHEQLSGLLKDVINGGMKGGLEWLKESLQDIIDDEDRDESDTVDIPLVPLSEDSVTAMDSPRFQRLLRAIGIDPPADEQEAYWRVPASMLAPTITKHCRFIENALLCQDASLPVSNNEDLRITDVEGPSVSNIAEIRSSDTEESDSESLNEAKRDRSQDSNTEQPLLKKRRIILSDDDDQDDDNAGLEKQNEGSQKPNVVSRRRLISDDEDNDDNSHR